MPGTMLISRDMVVSQIHMVPAVEGQTNYKQVSAQISILLQM